MKMYFNLRKLKLIFAWLMILIAMLACKTSSMERENDHISCKDHNLVSGSWLPVASNCTYTCDNGTVLPGIFDENTPPEQSYILFYCNQAAASVAEDPIATEAPTEAPTESPTEAPTQDPTELPTPILTGEVTYCDASTHIINLRVVDDFNAENFDHQLSIGGVPMTCAFNQANLTLLTCSYPSTVLFPASIKVESGDGSVVNEFEFNGSGCFIPQVDKVDDNEEKTPKESPGNEEACDPVILAMDFVCVPLQ